MPFCSKKSKKKKKSTVGCFQNHVRAIILKFIRNKTSMKTITVNYRAKNSFQFKMISLVQLILPIVILFGLAVHGNKYKKINDGASTSQDESGLSEEEKRIIEAYAIQFIRLFVSDRNFNCIKYFDYCRSRINEELSELNNARPSFQAFDYAIYANFEDKLYTLLRYDRKESNDGETRKLSNHKARSRYYEKVKSKLLHSLKKNPHCTGFLDTFLLESSINISNITASARIVADTIGTTTVKPKNKSSFKKFYEKCQSNYK